MRIFTPTTSALRRRLAARNARAAKSGRAACSGVRGVAYMMVLVVVAAATLIAWAMLSAASLRAQVESNAVDAVRAQSLAESGANLAIYYLRFPERSPVSRVVGAGGDDHYPGQADLEILPGVTGTVSITVTNPRANEYRIVSIAGGVAGAGIAVTHTIVATASVDREAPGTPGTPGTPGVTGNPAVSRIRVTSWETP